MILAPIFFQSQANPRIWIFSAKNIDFESIMIFCLSDFCKLFWPKKFKKVDPIFFIKIFSNIVFFCRVFPRDFCRLFGGYFVSSSCSFMWSVLKALFSRMKKIPKVILLPLKNYLRTRISNSLFILKEPHIIYFR